MSSEKNSTVITLLTDFGTEDGYAGAMKGVILSDVPRVTLIDISHDIEPFNVRQAAFTLLNAAFYFPKGTIHLVVVDPGVGTSRPGLIVKAADHFFIGPDNGVFSFIYNRSQYKAFRIREELFGPDVSPTFHGRDIFAPCAVKVLENQAIDTIGEPIKDVISFYESYRRLSEEEYTAKVIHIDHFGNLILNFHQNDWKKIGAPEDVRIQLEHGFLYGIKNTFGEEKQNELLALWDSSGYLQIAQNQGNASKMLNLTVGHEVQLKIK